MLFEVIVSITCYNYFTCLSKVCFPIFSTLPFSLPPISPCSLTHFFHFYLYLSLFFPLFLILPLSFLPSLSHTPSRSPSLSLFLHHHSPSFFPHSFPPTLALYLMLSPFMLLMPLASQYLLLVLCNVQA